MKLIDYSHNDQLYFIESFLDKCQSLCDKVNDEKKQIHQILILFYYLK